MPSRTMRMCTENKKKVRGFWRAIRKSSREEKQAKCRVTLLPPKIGVSEIECLIRMVGCKESERRS